SASGSLTINPAGFAADATVLTVSEAGLTTSIPLHGAAASIVQAAGLLDVSLQFAAAPFASALASGTLSTQVRLAAAPVMKWLVTAAMSGGEVIVPPLDRLIPVIGQSRIVEA